MARQSYQSLRTNEQQAKQSETGSYGQRRPAQTRDTVSSLLGTDGQ